MKHLIAVSILTFALAASLTAKPQGTSLPSSTSIHANTTISFFPPIPGPSPNPPMMR